VVKIYDIGLKHQKKILLMLCNPCLGARNMSRMMLELLHFYQIVKVLY